jgi:sugar phosphate permease
MMRLGRRGSIVLAVSSHSMQMIPFGAMAIFLPLIRADLDLSYTQAGTLAVAGLTTYALMQIPAGNLADRLGPYKLFVMGLIGTNLLAIHFAFLDTYGWAIVNQAASGVFRSFAFAPGLLLVSSYFEVTRRSTALSIFVAGAASGGVAVNLLGPLLVTVMGWRGFLILSSALALVTVIAYATLSDSGPSGPSASYPDLAGLLVVMRSQVLWLAGYIQFVRLAMVQGLRYWLPTFLVADRGMSLTTAGLIVAISTAASVPANLLGGYLSDRLGRPLAVIGVSMVVLGTTSALLIPSSGFVTLTLVVGLQSIFLQAYFGPLFEVPIKVLGAESSGSISGFSNLCANVGALVFSFVLGATRDLTGSFDLGFMLLALACALGLLATLRLNTLARAAL